MRSRDEARLNEGDVLGRDFGAHVATARKRRGRCTNCHEDVEEAD